MTVSAVIEKTLNAMDVEWQKVGDNSFAVALPGEKRLKTACILTVGRNALDIEAFVMRAPEENQQRVYSWLLQRNTRMYAVAWAIDGNGDVYLSGRVPLESVSEDELDRIFGSVLGNSDDSFNILLELGFSSSIKREWAWRVKTDQPLANLAAFKHLAERSSEG